MTHGLLRTKVRSMAKIKIPSLCKGHPTYEAMRAYILSEEGVEACLAAVRRGEPGLAGVDKELQRRLGAAYSVKEMGTVNAGSFVVEALHARGLRTTGKHGKMPEGCLAKTALMWE